MSTSLSIPSVNSVIRFAVMFLVFSLILRLFVPENIRGLFRF